MSENVRLGVIVSIFILMGIGIWALFSDGDDADNPTDIISKPVTSTQSINLPDMNYAPLSDSNSAEEEKTTVEDYSVDESDNPTTVKGMSGSGKITGVVIMEDDSALPDNIEIALHYISDDSKIDVSIDTAIQTSKPNAKGEFTFEQLPLGPYVLLGHTEGYSGYSDLTLNTKHRARETKLIMYPSGTISGIVVNAEGFPIIDAHVSTLGYLDDVGDYYPDDSEYIRMSAVPVNELGEFSINDLWPDPYIESYKILAVAPGYSSKAPEETFPIGKTGITIVLDQGNNVSGIVLNAITQEPMPNIDINIDYNTGIAIQKTTTAEDGTFTFSMISAGKHFITTNKTDKVILSSTNKIEVQLGEDLTDIKLEMSTGASIAGRVYNKETKKGIAGVTVYAYPEDMEGIEDKTATTNSRGEYTITGMQEGAYYVGYYEADGYSESAAYDDTKNVFLTIAQKTTGIDFALEQGITISGMVVNSENKPVEHVWINGEGDGFESAISDKHGRFTLAGFSSNSTITIYAKISNFASNPIEVQIEEDNVVDVRVELVTAAKISGIIVDVRGNPIPNADIFVSTPDNPYGSGDISTKKGTFTIDSLTAGTYDLEAMLPDSWDYDPNTLATVTLKAGEHKKGIRLVLEDDEAKGDLSISGRVVDDQGKAIKNVDVYSYGLFGGWDEFDTSTDEFGDYTLTGLKDGQYEIDFDKTGYALGYLEEIVAGSTNVNITLPRAGTITGRIVSASSSEPVKAFSILMVEGVEEKYPSYREDEFITFHHNQGLFTVKNVEPGSATLFVRSPGYADTTHIVDGVRSAETLSDVLIKMGAGIQITGTVTNQQGDAVKDASIFLGEVPEHSWERERGGRATSNANGEFTLDGLGQGNAIISAIHPDYMPDSVNFNITPSSNHVNLILQEGAGVEGYVTLNGEPLPNAMLFVSIDRFNVQGQTDSEGFYQIKGLPSGTGILMATLMDENDQRNKSTNFQPQIGLITEYNFDFTDTNSSVEGYIMLSETETTSGTLTLTMDADSGGDTRYMEVESDGYYLFENLSPGTVSLMFMDSNFENLKQTTGELGENETLRLDIKLYGGATLQCFVQNIPQDYDIMALVFPGDVSLPVPLSETTFMSMFSKMAQMGEVQPDGTLTLTGLSPDDYTVILIAAPVDEEEPNLEDAITARATFSITAEETTNLTMSF